MNKVPLLIANSTVFKKPGNCAKTLGFLFGSIALFALSTGLAPAADMELQPWSEGVFEQINKEHGAAAEQRMRNIYQLIQQYRNKPLMEKLKITNDTLNNLPWLTDRDQWQADDYWATPFETLTKFGGDCEDMAIGKWMVLRLMGVPKKNLRMGYVTVKNTGEAHMVLVWVNNQRNDSLVLDNYVDEIMSGKDRTDLLAVYLTDAEGNLILFNDNGNERKIAAELDNRKLAKLEKVKMKMANNHEKYKKYNNGQPLYIK